MNHEFISNPNHPEKCIECAYTEDKHGDNAICECCDKTGNLQIFGLNGKMALLTRECMERERIILEAEINSPAGRKRIEEFQSSDNQENRLLHYNTIVRPYDKLIGEAHKLDDQLHLSSDIFTAMTIPIEHIRKAIWADTEIPQNKKFFEFVSECKRRINHFQTVIFELDRAKIEAYSAQKAWHIAMNDYANKLRTEEREQLRIQDITYDVKMPKPITQKAIKVNASKVTKTELRNAVNNLNSELIGSGKDGIQEFTVQMLMVSKNWNLEQACNHLRRSVKEGKSE